MLMLVFLGFFVRVFSGFFLALCIFFLSVLLGFFPLSSLVFSFARSPLLSLYRASGSLGGGNGCPPLNAP